MNEVQVMQILSHPNIIKYYEYTHRHNRFYILMEFADQGTCGTRLYSSLVDYIILARRFAEVSQ